MNHSYRDQQGHLYCWGDDTTGHVTYSLMVTWHVCMTCTTVTMNRDLYSGGDDTTGHDTYSYMVYKYKWYHDQQGHVYCWGEDTTGATIQWAWYVFIHGYDAYLLHVTRTNHSYRDLQGHLYCWGDDTTGQLGLGPKAGRQASYVYEYMRIYVYVHLCTFVYI